MEWFRLSHLFCKVPSTLPHFIALVIYHSSVRKPALVSSWIVFRYFSYRTYDMLVICEKFRGREILHNILTGIKKKKSHFLSALTTTLNAITLSSFIQGCWNHDDGQLTVMITIFPHYIADVPTALSILYIICLLTLHYQCLFLGVKLNSYSPLWTFHVAQVCFWPAICLSCFSNKFAPYLIFFSAVLLLMCQTISLLILYFLKHSLKQTPISRIMDIWRPHE